MAELAQKACLGVKLFVQALRLLPAENFLRQPLTWFGKAPAIHAPERTKTRLNIYVGNLPFSTSEDDLRQAFGKYGTVGEVNLIRDQFSGRLRGFGFVEMADATQGNAAIQALNGTDLGGRAITVNEARPRAERGDRGDRGGRPGGGNRGGNRGDRDRDRGGRGPRW